MIELVLVTGILLVGAGAGWLAALAAIRAGRLGRGCPCPQCSAIRARSAAVGASTRGMTRRQRRELHRGAWEHLRR